MVAILTVISSGDLEKYYDHLSRLIQCRIERGGAGGQRVGSSWGRGAHHSRPKNCVSHMSDFEICSVHADDHQSILGGRDKMPERGRSHGTFMTEMVL